MIAGMGLLRRKSSVQNKIIEWNCIMKVLAFILLITGGKLLLFSSCMISLIGLYELYRVFKIEKTALGAGGYLAVLVCYLNLMHPVIQDSMLFVVVLLAGYLWIYVFSYPKFHGNQVFGAFFGVFYVGVMMSYIYQTRMMPNGQYLVWLIFLASWGCDTCAYCVCVIWKA